MIKDTFIACGLLTGLTLASVVQAEIVAPVTNEDVTEVVVQWHGSGDQVSVITTDNVMGTVEALNKNPLVEFAEPNVQRYVSVFPNDTSVGDQYHLQQVNDVDIDAGKAWNISTGSRDIVVAVIDTGIDLDHPDLADNIWTNLEEVAGNNIDDDGNGYVDDVNGWDFVNDDNDPNPTPDGSSWSSSIVVHGTHVAGLIGAVGNNTIGVSGVNWQVRIMPIRVFTDTGSSTIDDIYNAVNYAANNGADIINMSYGGGSYSAFEQEAIEVAYEKGALSVAAAGNDAINLNQTLAYPVCHPYVLGVGATDANDATASFSNFGTNCVDVAAPGDTILSTFYTNDSTFGFTDDYGYLSGTSMAAPIVSGIAALALSERASTSPGKLSTVIIQSTDSITDKTLGSGRVNAYSAVQAIQNLDYPAAPDIVAYHNSTKNKTIPKNTPTPDTNPYFTWKEPDAANSITGYYLYWGKQKKNPVTAGNFRTKRTFSPTGVRGDNTAYRLRIVAVDSVGNYSEVGTFKYSSNSK